MTSLGFRTDLALRVLEGAMISDRGGYLVIVADPANAAIRIYRACGLTDRESQFSFERAST